MKETTVSVAQAATMQEGLPARVQEALGELVDRGRARRSHESGSRLLVRSVTATAPTARTRSRDARAS